MQGIRCPNIGEVRRTAVGAAQCQGRTGMPPDGCAVSPAPKVWTIPWSSPRWRMVRTERVSRGDVGKPRSEGRGGPSIGMHPARCYMLAELPDCCPLHTWAPAAVPAHPHRTAYRRRWITLVTTTPDRATAASDASSSAGLLIRPTRRPSHLPAIRAWANAKYWWMESSAICPLPVLSAHPGNDK
jgi:hypothetical protein